MSLIKKYKVKKYQKENLDSKDFLNKNERIER